MPVCLDWPQGIEHMGWMDGAASKAHEMTVTGAELSSSGVEDLFELYCLFFSFRWHSARRDL